MSEQTRNRLAFVLFVIGLVGAIYGSYGMTLDQILGRCR